MRTDLLTPHQFEPVSRYIDTIVAVSHTLTPLDIAAPRAASQLIADQIGRRLLNRFAGRSTLIRLGSVFLQSGFDPQILAALPLCLDISYQFGVLLVDRTLTGDSLEWQDADGRLWLVIDWWQWVRLRVPARRRSDAWMFLSHACPDYFASDDRIRLGMSQETAQSMADEGQKLMRALTEWVGERLATLWQLSAPKHPQE